MYKYNEIDKRIIADRVRQFRGQVERRLGGTLSEDEFRPLRLMNGLYYQRHAYMLRIAVPYGLLSSDQLRMFAKIAREYDRGFGHFTTRQNIQFNWLELDVVPDILEHLSSVEMHAVQTSGNCIRNTTCDPLAGVAVDEIEDPRPYCELIRQYSTFHPEFSYLPRKFKIAVSGATHDRAAVAFHDIGIRIVKNDEGRTGFRVLVGGGMGRTPVIAKEVCPFLEKEDLLSYIEAIMRVYNLHGRRDNKYKARIKILVNTLGIEEFRRQVEEEWSHFKDGAIKLTEAELDRVRSFFTSPAYQPGAAQPELLSQQASDEPAFALWRKHNVHQHRVSGYNAVWVSLKSKQLPPGDMTDKQMDAVADLADAHSFGEIRTTHDQNLILADVPDDALYALWEELRKWHLATPNIGSLTDQICCPGLDFCSLANASSIPVAEEIAERFDELDFLHDLGEIQLKMSGCINACGHHHVGHIGILGIDKRGEEFYQIMLGGSATDDASLGKWLGPALARDKIVDGLSTLLDVFVELREGEERFLDTYRRVGPTPFKERVYA